MKNSVKRFAKGRFPYIPLPMDSFITYLNHAIQLKPESKNFLDIGCGLGVNMYLASKCGLIARGIDVVEDYVKLANDFFCPHNCFPDGVDAPVEAFVANALTYNGYGKFDILYMYQPLAVPTLQIKLFRRVAKQMKKGALLIYVGNRNNPPKGIKPVSEKHLIWQKME